MPALLVASLAVPTVAAGTPNHPSKASRVLTVTAALQRLQRGGQISQAGYLHYQQSFAAARRSLARLSGTRREELGAVLANVEAMAARGLLSVSRLPAVFATVQRNREWWTTRYLPSSGERVSFAGSRLVWEYYQGQGIEIQWLGTFGEANGYYLSHDTAALREVLDEAIALASRRAGGIAWEYLFQFDGGSPPWTSGLSQGTALQALARAWSRTHETAYLDAAREALGVFRARPSAGVLERRPVGSHYLEYTYAPGERILNGFVQSLVGLYEYAKLTGDAEGQALFEAGDAAARAETPRYDTGAWSLYDQHSESDLSYHELLAEFLEHLCERTRDGEPLAGAGTGAHAPIAGDEVYCAVAKHFREYVKAPPVLELLTRTLHTSQRAGVQVRLSKVASVSMSISLGGRTVWTNGATVEGGRPRLLWVTPSRPGTYTVALRARDLAGNEASASGTIVVSRGAKGARLSAVRLARGFRPQPNLDPHRLPRKPRGHARARLLGDRRQGAQPRAGAADRAGRPDRAVPDQGHGVRRLDPRHRRDVRGPREDLARQAWQSGRLPVAVCDRAGDRARTGRVGARRSARDQARAHPQVAGRALEARVPRSAADRLRARREAAGQADAGGRGGARLSSCRPASDFSR